MDSEVKCNDLNDSNDQFKSVIAELPKVSSQLVDKTKSQIKVCIDTLFGKQES